MNNITKVSEITIGDLASYLRLDFTDIDSFDADEKNTLNNLLSIAINYIVSYTGHTREELDNYPDLVIAVFVLVQDMYDNRSMYIDSSNVNKTVDIILSMHSANLLPSS